MLVGVIVPHVIPAGIVSVRLTVPVNPFTAETVIVDEVVVPIVVEGELVAIVKSVTLNVVVAE